LLDLARAVLLLRMTPYWRKLRSIFSQLKTWARRS